MTDDEALYQLRQRIDELDDQLLDLFNRRAAIVIAVQELKRKAGWPLFNAMREEQVITRVVARNRGPLHAHQVRSLYSAILQFFCKPILPQLANHDCKPLGLADDDHTLSEGLLHV